MNPKATDEQIEEAVESGKVQDVFTDRMLERNQAAKHALAYVKVRGEEANCSLRWLASSSHTLPSLSSPLGQASRNH